ncbi:metal-dependent hydrolase family protein [Companilactobacillus halodurans]|uniref:Amidohydrolase family protein n=1 Tax=Companilactobacillus halodurans TaxID=2584183 RepID=A0A5P0ZW64_9LACO|nr:amidohydrolase family protein [Companilactobacillus halodurans]MQS97082.1 amidohydrolase family protein [Companilactobacillus halodurans]
MKTLYKNFGLFDGEKAETQPDAWFIIDDETGEIEKLGFKNAPDTEKVVDLAGKFVMPGLINTHVHLMMNAITNKLEYLSEAEVTFTALNNLKEALKAGVTYVRDCGCAFDVDIKLHKLQEEGQLGGTEIVPSGRPMCITGGHADFTEGIDGETTWGNLVDSPDEMRHAVRREFKLGAKNIKVMATGGVMSSTDQIDDVEFSMEELKTAVEEAHTKHMTIAAHAEGTVGIHNAILAGVDSIEHGCLISDDDIELIQEKGIYLTPTVIATYSIPAYGEGKLPDYMVDKAKGFKDKFYARMKVAIKGGVTLAFGTDAGTPFNTFSDIPKELELLTDVGASNEEALFAATRNSSHLLRIDDKYGSIKEGKIADFLVLDEDPLKDIKAVQQKDKQVYKKGKLVE